MKFLIFISLIIFISWLLYDIFSDNDIDDWFGF